MQPSYKSCLCIVILFSSLFTNIKGQSANDTIKNKPDCRNLSGFLLKDQTVPLVLISSGLIIESANIKKEIQGWFPGTDTKVENYLQYTPIGILYISDIAGSRHRNNAFNQTKLLVISELTTGLLVHAIKNITNVTRPNGGTHSFPSGHTTQAFTAATVLYRECIGYDPALAYSGYLFSTATGVLRITNNRHWISDVLVGAGVGIIVTNLVYCIDPFKNWDPFKLNRKAEIIPDIDINSGIYCLSVRISMK